MTKIEEQNKITTKQYILEHPNDYTLKEVLRTWDKYDDELIKLTRMEEQEKIEKLQSENERLKTALRQIQNKPFPNLCDLADLEDYHNEIFEIAYNALNETE
jgi:hypothetical protein